jgi:hypothetical protein
VVPGVEVVFTVPGYRFRKPWHEVSQIIEEV